MEAIVFLALLEFLFESLELAKFFFLLTGFVFVVLLVLVALVADGRVHTFCHDGFRNTTLDILVCDIGFLLQLLERGRLVDTVVSPQRKYEDVLWMYVLGIC